MFSWYWPTQGTTRNLTGEATFLIDRQFTGSWDAFVEYAGRFQESGGPQHLLHFGAAIKVAKRQQIDFHFGVGLSSAAVDHFIGIGYSFRFQGLGRQSWAIRQLEVPSLNRQPRTVLGSPSSKLVSFQTHRRGTRML
jgi:hypothetical protein